jgi:Outer membrane protein and related peptidoglycan-associated (lipo)proteins
MSKVMKLMLVFALVLGVTACSKNVKKDAGADANAYADGSEVQVVEELSVEEEDNSVLTVESVKLEPVYFAFNEYSLNAQSRKTLEDNASILKERGVNKIVIEGNCDDRGTISYNIVLGDKRAQEVKNYYIRLGVPAGNISVVSYGEEKPVCTESTDACWSENRRADTVVL